MNKSKTSVSPTISRTVIPCLFERLLACLLATAALVLVLFALPAPAVADEDSSINASWHDVYLTDGQTYDIATASANTTVHINTAGRFTLKGSSSKVRVVVSSGDAQVYLADGLNINTGALSNVGQRTAAITIENMGGTVALISKAGATAKMSGYFRDPAIEKNGTNTKLVFETETPSNPGTIEATASLLGGAAIGTKSIMAFKNNTTGNIEINSGKIIAKGGQNSAGIGGGDHGVLDGLVIHGGYVEATGGAGKAFTGHSAGAGIGGGSMGSGKNIRIEGGTVVAQGGNNGAGIGGGAQDSGWGGDAVNIAITGGSVSAYGGLGGAGIGGGWEGNARSIHISGGIVNARASVTHSQSDGQSGAGIGGGGGNFHGTGSDIKISGGTVNAKGGGESAAIGSTQTGEGETSVTISGGVVTATAGSRGTGIGGGGTGSIVSKKGTTMVSISGGTINAVGSNRKHGIDVWNSTCSISIIGGSLKTNGCAVTPVNQSGAPVGLTTIALAQAVNATKVDAAVTLGIDPAYGMNDVYTQDTDKLYFWFPDSSTITRASAHDGLLYAGSVASGTSGTLYPATRVVLDAHGGAASGNAQALLGDVVLSNLNHAQAGTGKHLVAYMSAATGGQDVTDATGSLQPNTLYSDANAQWSCNQASITLYARWASNTYKVAFDANHPDAASHDIEGSMNNQALTYDAAKALTKNTFSLAGWSFAGWNTQADGGGAAYADGAVVDNLTTEQGGTVTLYAQWVPKGYQVEFYDGNDTTKRLGVLNATYDNAFALLALKPADIPSGKVHLGWESLAFGSFYAPSAHVVNFCTLDAEGNPAGKSLYAKWGNADKVHAVMTNDGIPVELADPATEISLDSEGTRFMGFAKEANGVYVASNLPSGAYGIQVNGWNTTGKTVAVDASGSGMVALEYCTVKVGSEEHGNAAASADGSIWETGKLGSVLLQSRIRVKAEVDEGYAFESWTAVGASPTWQDDDPTLPAQSVGINGSVQFEAHPVANLYSVAFDANYVNASGMMPDQDMVYDEPQNLFANQYSRTGYSFAGWTTTPQWQGTLYANGQSVQNLTTVAGGTVTLYAQWTPQAYYIEFNGNGGNTGMMLDQKCFYDTPSALEKSDMKYENYHFTGWNTRADGTGLAYADEGEVVNLSTEPEGMITLWAQWEHDAYTVAYDANGGVGQMEASGLWCYEPEQLAPCAFTREGYAFAAWNTAPDGSGARFADVEQVSDLVLPGEKITLYAQWAENPNPVPDPDSDSEPTKDPVVTKLASTGDSLAGLATTVLVLLSLVGAAALFLMYRKHRCA